jgi:two-component system response regulator AlgR
VSSGASGPLRVLIVDDEPLARLRLRGLVEANTEPPARVVGEAGDAQQAQALLSTPTCACDLVLLDIAMPGASGLQLADALRRAAQPPLVVFVTAHASHALRAFELDAADYITKPVRRERLQAALWRVAQRRAGPVAAAEPAEPGPVLVVSDRGRVLRVPQAEVVSLKAEQKYVTLRTGQGQWLLDEPLADLAQRLGDGFLRVHRNAVVARSAVRALERAPVDGASDGDDGWIVRLANGEALAVSRRQLPAVREALAEPGHKRS